MSTAGDEMESVFDPRRVRLALIFLAVVVLTTGGYAIWVHERTGYWSLDRSRSVLDTIEFNGRSYNGRAVEPLPADAVLCEKNTLPDGKPIEVFVDASNACGSVPVIIHARADGKTWIFGLVGGP